MQRLKASIRRQSHKVKYEFIKKGERCSPFLCLFPAHLG
jgi:hypothetical protein